MSLFVRSRCLKKIIEAKNINAILKFSSSTPSGPGIQDSLKPSFTPVFKFPHIRLASLINRCKFLQTISTVAVVPGSVVLSVLDVIEPQTGVTAVLTGLSLCAFLYILGNLSNKLIGIVYINEKEEFVRIAYLDFWGRRQDLSMPLGEIVPINETSASWMDGLYLKVNRRSPVKQVFKLNLKFGGIVDHHNFNKIFMVN